MVVVYIYLQGRYLARAPIGDGVPFTTSADLLFLKRFRKNL